MRRLIANGLRLGIVLAVVIAGAGAYTYYRSDELLREEVLRQLGVVFPTADIQLSRANYDWRGRVRLFQLSLSLPDDRDPFVTIPEVVLTVDAARLAERQEVLLKEVYLRQPMVRVTRDPAGRWNYAALEVKPPAGGGALPVLEVAHGAVELLLADAASRTMVRIPWEDLQLEARPATRESYSLELRARQAVTGPVIVRGELSPDGAGRCDIDLALLHFDRETVRLATLVAPPLETQLAALRQRLDQVTPRDSSATRYAAADGSGGPPVDPYDLGVAFDGRVSVSLSWAAGRFNPDWRTRLELTRGELTHALLPSPLFDVAGVVEASAERVTLTNFTARNGQSALAGRLALAPDGALELSATATKIPLDEPLITRLPQALQRIVRSLALTGTVSGEIAVTLSADGTRTIDADARLYGGTVRHERFPYLVRDVTGTLAWHHDELTLEGQGRAGTHAVTLYGTIQQPGPTGSAAFEIRAQDVTVDDALLAALPESVAKVARDLRFQGRGDVWVRLLRPAGWNQKYGISLTTQVREASLQYVGFPYPITDLSGRLKWVGEVVDFEELRGLHDGAVLTGVGRLSLKPESLQLELAVNAVAAEFDRALYTALPTNLRGVWDTFAPRGTFDVATRLDWRAGQPVRVDVPELRVRNGSLAMRDFPYPFHDLRGLFRFDGATSRVTIEEFTARHDDTRLSGRGGADCHADGTVTVALATLHVDDLVPTPALRRALPESLREIVEALNPLGRYSFEGPVTFYGDQARGGLVGADWNLQVVLAACAINAGLRVDDIHGRVAVRGRWTPEKTELTGQLELDALDVLVNHQVTNVRGPFQLRDGVLVAGSAAHASSQDDVPAGRVPLAERITGEAFDGEVLLDAVVDLNAEPIYKGAVELTNASLEKYAQRHWRGSSNVRGLMNGWMEVRGRGIEMAGLTGEGQLQISPAALYELPVFLQIFQLPQFAPINRTAFDYANFFFRLADERFNFPSIDLVGNTISLKGRGVVSFDGAVTLDFFTMQPRNQVQVPLLRELVGAVNLVSQGWLAVEVRGPIGAPVARVVPFPVVDEAMRQFLGAFEPRPRGPPPTFRRGETTTDRAGAQAPPR